MRCDRPPEKDDVVWGIRLAWFLPPFVGRVASSDGPQDSPGNWLRGCLGAKAYAVSKALGHMALLLKLFAPSADLSPIMVGVSRESLFTHLRKEEAFSG